VIAANLPALLVVVPLLAAPVCLLVRSAPAAWTIVYAASIAAFAAAVALLERVLADGVISYAMGGWPPPWGIEYRIDAASAFVSLIVTGVNLVVLAAAPRSLAAEIERERLHLAYALWALCVAGLLGIAVTGDAFNLFVFLEISSLSSYALISLSRDRRALTAAFRYLVLGTIGATFILIGTGFLYVMTGTLNMVDLGERVAPLTDSPTIKAALAFITVGVGIKMALFPLHAWLPNAYAYAPSAVSAFLAASATKVAIYAWLRFSFTVFGAEFAYETLAVERVLLPLALAGALIASLYAVFQNDVKRLLAYSSVAQVGYMVAGVSLATATGLTAGIVHLFNHALIKGGLFLALACVVFRTGSARLERLAGVGRRMPVTMAAFVLGGLGLIGVPLTAGFISKWYLIQAALELDLWLVAALVVVSSLVAVVYVGRVIEVAYFRAEPEPAMNGSGPREAPLSLLVPACVLVAATLWFGVETSLSAGVARRAADALLGAGP